MKNTIVLGLLSTLALFAVGAIGNIAMPVFAGDDDEYKKATLYCKITYYEKDDYYDDDYHDDDYDNFDKSDALKLNCKIGDYDKDDDD
jgi:hypothetical protein